MIKRKLTSRQRMLAALNHQEPDHTPCSFMLYGGLKSICNDYEDFIERQLGLGLDVFVELPPRPPVVVNDHYNLHGLPVSYDPRVKIREWQEDNKEGVWPVLVKEYETPAEYYELRYSRQRIGAGEIISHFSTITSSHVQESIWLPEKRIWSHYVIYLQLLPARKLRRCWQAPNPLYL
jgi:hypothetical protein